MSRRVLCVDPGFEWLGWAVVAAGQEVDTAVAMGLVRTSKSDKKRGVRQADDNFSRVQGIAREIWKATQEYQPHALVFESYSQVRGASAAGKIALSYGVLALLSVLPSRVLNPHYMGRCPNVSTLPVVSATPGEVRKALGGAASKKDVERAVRRHFRSPRSIGAIEVFEKTYAKNKANHTHGWDALAVYLACRESEVVRALRFL